MKESRMRTKLAHTGDLELAKKIQSSVSVPKVLPIYMSSVFRRGRWLCVLQNDQSQYGCRGRNAGGS